MNNNRYFTWIKGLVILVMLSSVNLSLFAWTAPQQISTNDPCECAKVAIDPSGNIIAVWISGTAPNTTVQTASRQVSTGIWSTPTNITTTGIYHNPAVVMSSAGYATAVWEHEINGKIAVESSRLPLGGAWTTIKTVSQNGVNTLPQLVVDSSNNVTAAWLKDDRVVAARLVNGNWGVPVSVQNTTGNSNVDIAINTIGNILLTWFNAGNNTSYASAFINNTWTTPLTIDPVSNGSAGVNAKAAVGLNNAGNAIAVWSNFDVGVKGKYNHVYNQAWSQSVSNLSTDYPNTGTKVVLGTGGFGVSIWINSTTGLVQGSSFSNNAWSIPQVLSNNYDNESTKLIIDGSNNATAFWCDAGVSDIKSSKFLNQLYWSYPPEQISTNGYNASPSVAGNVNGKAVVAWVHNEGGNNVIQASVN